jgi:hypothetical protein
MTFISWVPSISLTHTNIDSCFPHITNLACKAVLAALTNISLAAIDDNTVDLENEEIP